MKKLLFANCIISLIAIIIGIIDCDIPYITANISAFGGWTIAYSYYEEDKQ